MCRDIFALTLVFLARHNTFSKEKQSMDRSTFINALLLCLLNVIFMIAGIFLNSVVIISLRRSSQLRKKLCYFMILLLSCFDLVVVIFAHPVVLLTTIFWAMKNYNGAVKYIWEYTCIFFSGYSGIALLTLNIERFLAIKYPFLHQTAVTKRRLVLFQAFWIIIAFCSMSPLAYFYGRTVGNMVIIAYILCIFSLFVYLNYNMYTIAKSIQKGARVTRSSATLSVHYHERKERKLNLKNISTCSLVVGCYFICFFPQFVYSVLRLIRDSLPNDEHVTWLFNLWSSTLVAMNSTFNCLIFFWRNSILRREGMKIVKCLFKINNYSSNNVT